MLSGALDQWQAGRVVVSADSNIVFAEGGDCPIWQWLGGTSVDNQRVLSLGKNIAVYTDLSTHPDHVYAGTALAPPYADDAAQLAADFDIVVFSLMAAGNAEYDMPPVDYEPADLAILTEFVTVHGGGLYLVGDYFNDPPDGILGGMRQAHVDAINDIAELAGVRFEQSWLVWGNATGRAEIACFPPVG